MSDKIKRFDPIANTGFDECWASMDEWENGDYVLYADHAKIVAELKLEIHKARSEGAAFGQAAGFRMGLARAIRIVDLELSK